MTRARFRGRQAAPGHPLLKLAALIAVFALVLGLFFGGLDSLSESTRRRQRESLENAVNRAITYCYAAEGAYPESLAYLKRHYGLTYDENRFYVDYQPRGGNILPDVTILEKED